MSEYERETEPVPTPFEECPWETIRVWPMEGCDQITLRGQTRGPGILHASGPRQPIENVRIVLSDDEDVGDGVTKEHTHNVYQGTEILEMKAWTLLPSIINPSLQIIMTQRDANWALRFVSNCVNLSQ